MSNNYEETGEQIDQKVAELEGRLDALGEHVGDGVIDYQQLAAALEPYLETGGGRSDEEIRQLVAEYVDEHVETGGGMTQAEVEEIVTASLADLDIQGFDQEVIERVRYHSEALDFPARRVGPSKPIGDFHASPMWGVGLRTGRECYIHSAKIDANESETFNVKLGEFDGRDRFDLVDETDVQASGGVERVDLDLQVPEAGRYLLAVDSDLPLRRGAWNGWDDHMIDNLQLVKGDKPGFSQNDYWYKLFDIEITANENHEFPA